MPKLDMPTVYMRPHVNMRPRIVPLECNIDVTSLKVSSQMTRYSMIQTIYTFPEFNPRPCIFMQGLT